MTQSSRMLTLSMVAAVVCQSVAVAAQGKPPAKEELDKVRAALPASAPAKPANPRKLLVFNLCKGFYHGCIPLAGEALEMLGEKTGAYEAEISSDMAALDAASLAKFDAVLFNNTTRLGFTDPARKQALLDFVKGGKGFVGIHASSDNFYNWPEAAAMQGGQFDGHPWGAGGTWAVKVDDPSHPLNKAFGGKGFQIGDEIYQVKGAYSRDTLRVLVSLDMSDDKTRDVRGIKRKDNDFAISWIREYGKGRVFYCSFGHNNEIFWNPAILQHYLAGIQYALGDLRADATPSSKLSKKTDYSAVLKYEFGQNRSGLGVIEAELRGATPSQLTSIEGGLIDLLGSPEATVACKQFVCRMLRRCGTEKCVPVLASLLTDKQLSHMARFALQTIESPRVDAVLREALGKAAPAQKAGIVGTLGARRDAGAVPAIAALVSSGDRELAEAAIAALGRIGTADAAKALTSGKVKGHDVALADAQLTCAERMAKTGNNSGAVGLYKALFAAAQPARVRVAALRGLVIAEKERVVPALVNVLGGDDEVLKKHAVGAVAELPAGETVTKAIADQLASLAPPVQVALIGTLTARGDAAAAPAVAAVAGSKDPAARQAALRALGVLGNEGSVPVLLAALKEPGDVGKTAYESLCCVGDAKAGGVLVSELKRTTDGALRCRLVDVLAARAEKTALPSFVAAVKDKDANVRKAAARALAAIGGAAEVAPVLSVLTATGDADDRRGMERALGMIAARAENPDDVSRPVAVALAKAKTETAEALIGILKRAGGAVALAALRKELKSSDVARRRAVVRALADWEDDEPAADLLQIAQGDADVGAKVLALRGYCGFAARAGGVDGVGMYRKALEVATRPEDKKVVLGGLGALAHRDALALVEPFLSQSGLRAEAELAYGSVAKALAAADPAAATPALKKVTTFKNEGLVKEAGAALDEIGRSRSYVTSWLVSGPYTKSGLGSDRLLDTAFPPEDPGAKNVKWRPVTKIDNGQVMLDREFGGETRVAYLLTSVSSPKARKVRLEMGSDDGIKVWLNGKVVHKNNVTRPHQAGSDRADADLKQGANRLLVKITQGGGEWSASMRIRNADGSPAQGVAAAIPGL